MKRGLVRLTMVALLLALPVSAQESTQPVARVPFGVGERLEFDI